MEGICLVNQYIVVLQLQSTMLIAQVIVLQLENEQPDCCSLHVSYDSGLYPTNSQENTAPDGGQNFKNNW